MDYILSIKQTNNSLSILLLNKNTGEIVFKKDLPVFYEFDGELIEDDSFVLFSNIGDFKDYNKIKQYLVSIGIIESSDKLWMDENEKIYFESGGNVGTIKTTLEKKIKTTKDGLYLPYEISIYVPTTKNKNEKITEDELMQRIKEVSLFLSETFGGFTRQTAVGGYKSSENEIITEDIVKITSFSAKKDFENNSFKDNFFKLIDKCKHWCKIWTQEAIGLEFEGDMFYITEDLMLKSGGVIKESHFKNKFNEDVNKIAEKLYNKKVPYKYQNEYGKRYSKSEAILAAKRIKGALINKKK